MREDRPSEAQRRRRKHRREEWGEQVRLSWLLGKYLDPATTFWTSLENRPSSFLNGLLQKKRGVKSGLPDVMVIFCQRPVFVEVKSRAGIASKAQRRVRAALLAAGVPLVACSERTRWVDGVASLRRSVSAAMEAALASAVGRAIHGR